MNQNALLNPADAGIAKLDQTIAEAQKVIPGAGAIAKAIAKANAVALLRSGLDEKIMQAVMALQGTSLGFRTDKDKDGGYPVNIVKDCAIEASLRGLNLTGNEFNIIAARFYCTKEGMTHLLRNVQGLKFFISPQIPKMTPNGAIVDVDIEWSYNGESQKKTHPFAIRVNSGMGADAIIGKAKRKAMAWLYEYLTGNAVDEGEADEMRDVTPRESPLVKQPQTSEKTDDDEIGELLQKEGVSLASVKAWFDAKGYAWNVRTIKASVSQIANSVKVWEAENAQ